MDTELVWWPFVLVFGVALTLALISTPLAAAWGRRRGIVDRPGARRWHKGAIPRTGGIALFVAFMAAALLAQWLPVPRQDPKELTRFLGIAAGMVFLFVAGYIDDRYELRPGPQYAVQAVSGIIAILCLVFIERVMNPFTDELFIFPYWFIVAFTLVWIMGMINTINFLDGLDGLATGVGAIVSAVLAIHMLREGQYSVALLPLALLGATLGFLPFNFAPAKLFLGSGSLFLGYAIATLGIAAGAKLALLLLVLAIPIVDVAWLIISRLRAGESIGQADRRHLHFRLLDLGLSQRQVVLLYYGYCALLGASALLIDSRILKLITLVVLGLATLGILAWLARQTLQKER
ncbi:MAG: undecaprenyl/decaprenyl-phosphate alpha-N-acetylglucosaminyl 1-phosphate transferase [Anaerolineae bacterium]|nr:undecaprenyl/decaprenyl-phosphate alpha-N-acetylglucosaminyl 1-phosphate transferase [Anaerolineae bacterium]